MSEISVPKRVVGLGPLILSGITCIIGSGWLFGVALAANTAGPAAIFSWIIGGVAIMIIALTIAELGTMFPRSGGMVHYMYESHGNMIGFFGAWINWIAITPVIATEAVASTQYLSSWNFKWCHSLYNPASGDLTGTGLMVASVLLIAYFLLNFWGMQLLIRALKYITYFKIFVPCFAIVSILATAFHPENFISATTSFAPFGWSAVLTAIPVCGIIYTFNGFQTPVNIAGEVKNPGRNLPIAMLSSIAICLVIYVLLQIAFIGGLNPSDLAKGWHAISFRSPFAQIALSLNLNLLLFLIYLDAFVSPSGVGLTYFTTTSRMLFGMSQNGQMPKYLGKLNPIYLVPRGALWTVLLVCFIFLFLFRGWEHFAGILSCAEIITYLSGPIALIALRKTRPDAERPFRLPFAPFICLLAFVICSLMLHWATWPLSGEVIILGLAGFGFYIYYQNKQGWGTLASQFKSTLWLILYLIVMAIISYLGSKDFGGIGAITTPWDQVVVVILAIGFYFWGTNSYYKK
ncbi:MAG TPA: amino acid:proton symporter [Lentisphaeria bacterium]|nr:MAG: amino acid:proton symporter [Lentisphaerae bacterium GWF2_38_69]HBM14732.1 amino acid:proton symporter [Lentisphaeria bacterium]